MNNKLYVGNLSSNTTENQLKDTFAVHGTVTETNVVTDRTTGQSRGFGFVTMSSPDEANHAIEALNGKSIDGQAITVSVARPREGKPSTGGSKGKGVGRWNN